MTSTSQAAAAGADTPGPEDAGLSSTRVAKKDELAGRSPGRLMWTRFKRDRTGVISACIVLAFFLIAALAPVIAKLYGKDPYTRYGQLRPDLLNENFYPVKPNGGMDGEFWFGLEPGLGRGRLHPAPLRDPHLALARGHHHPCCRWSPPS